MNRLKYIVPAAFVCFSGCGLLDAEGEGGPRGVGIEAPSSSSAALVYYESCDALLTDLRASLDAEMTARLLNSDGYYGNGMLDSGGTDGSGEPVAGESDMASGGAAENSGDRVEGEDFSGTNNQEEGVDEADFVKTDGFHIYVLNGNRLEIMGVPEIGELNHASTTELEGNPRQMLLGEDRMVVFSDVNVYQEDLDPQLRELVADDEMENENGRYYYRYYQLTKATVIDITDRTAPMVERELYLESGYQTARRVEQSVWMVGYSWRQFSYDIRYWPELPNEYWELDYDDPQREELYEEAVAATILANQEIIERIQLDEFIPRVYVRENGSFTTHLFSNEDCQNFAATENMATRGVTSVLSLDLMDDTFAFDADHVMANWPVVYASQETLLIAEPQYDWWWYWSNDDFDEKTNIHRFDITTPGQTEHTGTGVVPGYVYGQFALSEYDGYVRVATTTDAWLRGWQEDPPEMNNHVYVLGGKYDLTETGHVSDLGIGERIWSSRFVGDKAYVVTFRTIDPLWTVDLSDPFNPQVIGELEIPGVSTYIHPMDDEHLLTIGFGGDEEGLDWSTQVSLFDVSDFANPTLASALSLKPEVENEDDWSWSWSEATYEHKAFQYWGPMSMLAVPLSTYRYVYEESDGSSDGASESGEPVDDTEEENSSDSGESDVSDSSEGSWGGGYYEYVSQLALINAQSGEELTRYGSIDHSDFFNSENRYWHYRDVRRSIFMGEYLYAISDRGVTAHKLEDMSLAAEVTLPGYGN